MADETWGVRIHVQAFNKKQSQTHEGLNNSKRICRGQNKE